MFSLLWRHHKPSLPLPAAPALKSGAVSCTASLGQCVRWSTNSFPSCHNVVILLHSTPLCIPANLHLFCVSPQALFPPFFLLSSQILLPLYTVAYQFLLFSWFRLISFIFHTRCKFDKACRINRMSSVSGH